MIVEVVLFILVITAGLILRYLPHILHYFPMTPDTFFHLIRLRDLKYESEIHTYPKFFHQFIRLFVRKKDPIPERVLNRFAPFIDVVTAISLYLFLRLPFGSIIALATVLLFLVTPIVVRNGIPFTIRPMGLLLVTLALLCLTLPFPFNWIAIIPYALTLLTHKLSTQTLFFISLGFAFFDLQTIFIYLAGFLVAILLSKGYYLRVLRHHVTRVYKFFTGKHYPNLRGRGLLLTPTVIGLLLYLVVQWIPVYFPQLMVILGFVIWIPMIVVPYFQTLLIVWGSVCILLLILWIGGESYKHLYIGAPAFAFFCAYLLQNGIFFFALYLVSLVGCVAVSAYLSFRFPHLSKDQVEVLRAAKQLDDPTTVMTFKSIIRAVEYFAGKSSIWVDFSKTRGDALMQLIIEKKVTHAIVDKQSKEVIPQAKTIQQEGDWFLLEVR